MFIATRHLRTAGLLLGCLAWGMLGSATPNASGGTFTLTDQNSVATFDTGAQAGANSWTVDGVNQLFQQWFWYRVGNTAEQSLDTLPIGVEGSVDTNFDGDKDSLFVRYLGAGFRVDVRFSLDGGPNGSGASNMAEQISITNLGRTSLDFHFFQYNDFDLANTDNDDTVVFTNANAVQQSDQFFTFSESVVTPVASHREIDFFNNTLAKLNDGLPTTLVDNPIGVPLGPGDVTWAFQWDFLIAPGATAQISKVKALTNAFQVPEPSTWMLLAIGGIGCLAAARRNRAKRS